jgi:hypothetical protein
MRNCYETGFLREEAVRQTGKPRTLSGRAAACAAAGALLLAVAGFAPSASVLPPSAPATVPWPAENMARPPAPLQQQGQEWESRLEGTESHQGQLVSRFVLDANMVVLHRSRPEIVGVRPGGHFRLREERGGEVRELEALPAPDGVRYRYTVNGAEASIDRNTRAWLAGYVQRYRPRRSVGA